MGLDMYLLRTLRIPGLPVEGYLAARGQLDSVAPPNTRRELLRHPDLLQAYPSAVELIPAVHQVTNPFCGSYLTIFDQMVYWRKQHALHAWLVDQLGVDDDPSLYAEVPEATCQALLAAIDEAPEALVSEPAVGPFGQEPGVAWVLPSTQADLTYVLATTDWSRQILIYHASY